ncbi:GNAT family N-acetyltransferase [Paenibacillus lycopersici]|uniref:GNAT family N-acetyltransferase n=2 Tax=Paenibacillus lycopersici TaxID=2704462 RepID=A0A6C0G8H5_9BACL|nr:GNAT family N-acetyltransferase [Paenibacillus lycopersici]
MNANEKRHAERYDAFAGLEIRRLGGEYADDAHRLMLDVVSRLPDSALFATDDGGYFTELLARGGELYGAFGNGKLAAYSTLAYPGPGDGNLGREFGVPEEELDRVWMLDATIVHESARGRGLQRFFHELRERRARELGARCLYSTVHPANDASRRNLEAAGFVRQFTRPMYGGLMRHCYAKRLSGRDERHANPSRPADVHAGEPDGQGV